MAITLFVVSRILGTGAHDNPYRAAVGELGWPTSAQIAQDPDGTMPFPFCVSVVTVPTTKDADAIIGNPAFIAVKSGDLTTSKKLARAQLRILRDANVEPSGAITQRDIVQLALNRVARRTVLLQKILPRVSIL